MPFPVVVYKGNRAKVTPKYTGGVFNPRAQVYVYKTEGNRDPMPHLKKVAVAIDMRDIMRVNHVSVD